MIRGEKNDLISLAVLVFLVAVYAHHQQNLQTLLACCACWSQCMIAVTIATINAFVDSVDMRGCPNIDHLLPILDHF